MNSATNFLDPFAESAEHGFAVHAPASIQRADRLHQLRFQFVQGGRQADFTLFLEPAQTGADDLAGGLIKAAVHFLRHEFFQFRCQ